jgi:hypothetical protein
VEEGTNFEEGHDLSNVFLEPHVDHSVGLVEAEISEEERIR